MNNRFSVLLKESKSITSDAPKFNGDKKSEIINNESLPDVLSKVLNDPEIRAFTGIQRDAITRSGYTIIGTDSAVKKANKKLKALNFRKLLKRITSDLIIFKHAFIEVQRNRSKSDVIGLKALDPTTIRPIKDLHDNILFWYQYSPDVDVKDIIGKVSSTTKKTAMDVLQQRDVPLWDINELSHMTIDETTSTFWGVTDMHTLEQINDIDNALLKHIELLFKQNWFRVHFHSKTNGDTDYQEFLDQFATNMEFPEDPMLTTGPEEMVGKKYVDETVLLPIIEMRRDLRNQKLTLLRVPPIIAGTVDNSNRSNSDVQAHYAFNNRVRAIQEDMEDDLDFDLFKKIGLQNIEFKFNEVSNRSLREIVDIMMLFISQGADASKMSEWAQAKGYDIPIDVWQKLEEKQKVELEQSKKLPENSNLQPSRKAQDNSNADGFGTPDGNNIEGQ